MTQLKHRWGALWALLFTLIFLLSQSNLLIDYTAQPGLLGFPNWLWIYGLIHAALLLVLWVFIKQYWEQENSDDA